MQTLKKLYILRDYSQNLVNRTIKTKRKIDNWPVHFSSIDYLDIILDKCKDLKNSEEYLKILKLRRDILFELLDTEELR